MLTLPASPLCHRHAEVPGSIALQYTPLLTSQNYPFYYNVKLLSLSVDGQLLQVSQVRWGCKRGCAEHYMLCCPQLIVVGETVLARPAPRVVRAGSRWTSFQPCMTNKLVRSCPAVSV